MFVVCYDSDAAAKQVEEDFSDIESKLSAQKDKKEGGFFQNLKDGLEDL